MPISFGPYPECEGGNRRILQTHTGYKSKLAKSIPYYGNIRKDMLIEKKLQNAKLSCSYRMIRRE